MLDHVSITVDDLEAAVRFYDAVLGALGYQRVSRTATSAGYGTRNSGDDDGHSYLSIVAQPGVSSDDRHWAFRAASRSAVDRFYAAAKDSGGRAGDSPRLYQEYHAGYYAAFVLDPAGNRIEAVSHRAPIGS